MKVAVNWKGNKETKEVSLDGQLVSDAFKAPTSIVRPAVNVENVGKLKVAPVAKKVVKEVAVTTEKVEVVERPVEKVEEKVEEVKTIADPATALETIEKLEKEIHTPAEPRKKTEDKKAGLKVKVTTQDGKTVESSVDHSSEDESKKSNMKVNNNPVSDANRHYKINHGKDLPRKSQIQLTAITFEQLKELDFKYRSIDLEFHKMFFEAKHEKSNPSISIDFDSIPKEKLLMLAGNEAPESEEEITALKEELEKAKLDLNTTEEALVDLRKISDSRFENISLLQQENTDLKVEVKNFNEIIASKDAEITELKKQLEELTTIKPEDEVKEEVVEEAPVETVEEDETEFKDFALIYGTWQFTKDVCDANGLEFPEGMPETIITFSASGETDDEPIKDQDGKISCMAWINGHPIDNLDIKPREQVTEESEVATEE